MRARRRNLWTAVLAVFALALAAFAAFYAMRARGENLAGMIGLSRAPAEIDEKANVRTQERYIWCGGKREGNGTERCVWIGRDGRVIEEALETRGSLIPILKPFASVGTRDVAPPGSQEMAAIASVIDLLKEFNLRFQEARVDLFEKAEGEIVIEKGPRLHFSLLFDASFSRPIFIFLKQQKKLSSLEYIDLRVENRAYYR
ncbi:MAG: hypothetical protein HY536_01265 [Candidatus Colwellbacteria bacterium]|nr:hypothetical protein [Candidatus Colwellbacteria bacterium]